MSAANTYLKRVSTLASVTWDYSNSRFSDVAYQSTNFQTSGVFSETRASFPYADAVYTTEISLSAGETTSIRTNEFLQDIYGDWFSFSKINFVFIKLLESSSLTSVLIGMPFIQGEDVFYEPSKGYRIRHEGLFYLLDKSSNGYPINYKNHPVVFLNESSVPVKLLVILVGTRIDYNLTSYQRAVSLFYGGDPGLGLNENWTVAFGNYDFKIIQSYYYE